MHDVILTVFVVTTLLGLVSLLVPLAEWLSIPFAVLLALVGISIGVAVDQMGAHSVPGVVGEMASTLNHFGLSAESLLYIFLPALLFETALGVDIRQLGDEIAPVLLLAIVGVFVCTFVAGFAVWGVASWLSPIALLACIILAAIIATTDPVAVVAIFRDIGAPKRLSTLVEGESLFNDAAAIAIYSLAVAMLVGDRPASPLDGIMTFLREFVGGLAAGYVAGRVLTRMLPILGGSRFAEMTLTIGFAYFIFILCDHYLGLSGVVAVAAAALAVSAGGRRQLSPSNWESLVVSWGQLAFWASSLIFLLASIQTPELLKGARWADLALLIVLILSALLARGLTLYGIMPVLSYARIAEPISPQYKIVMLWGGMRGAVSLALALAATENTALSPEIRQFIGVLATGFVLFTLIVTAPTMRPLMRLLDLDQLSPAEIALRNRVIGLSLSSIQHEIDRIAQQHQITTEIAGDVASAYTAYARDPTELAEENAQLPIALRTHAALSVVADREQEFYLEYFERRTVSRRIAATLLAHAERLSDGVRSNPEGGYRKAAGRMLRFDRGFRFVLALHRRFRIDGPLARALAERFEVMISVRFVLHHLLGFNDQQVGLLFGKGPSEIVREELEHRINEVDGALAALKLQYPNYARQLETQFLARTAVRLEDERYSQLRGESIINREVYESLLRGLRQRRGEVEIRPVLDLGLRRAELVGQVPMFAALDEQGRHAVARLLRARLTVPGEPVVRKGERGDAMYFISSGAVEVRIPPKPIRLGSGNFFGEIALLIADRRTADVVSLGYCQLLTLAARDLDRLFETQPSLRDEIQSVAKARRAEATAS